MIISQQAQQLGLVNTNNVLTLHIKPTDGLAVFLFDLSLYNSLPQSNPVGSEMVS